MEAEQQLEQRRFAAARRAGDRDRIAGGDGQAGATQDLRAAAAVSEAHACKFDAAGEGGLAGSGPGRGLVLGRSAEHTSELQSLMRISYAACCLKKQLT